MGIGALVSDIKAMPAGVAADAGDHDYFTATDP